jgi:DNA-directed RNA polymerase specialized sigma24 family protein
MPTVRTSATREWSRSDPDTLLAADPHHLLAAVKRVLNHAYDPVAERRRAVALAGHFRESEGLSIAEIAEPFGRSPATVKAYFYDPPC